MKKLFCLIFILFVFISEAYASEIPGFNYKNITLKSKISYEYTSGKWLNKFDKKTQRYFIKTKGFGEYYDYIKENGDFGFTTDCEYEFLFQDSLIGYSNKDFRFYEFYYDGYMFKKRALNADKISELIPDYKIIKLSDFTKTTNSLRIKKGFGDLKLFILNDFEGSLGEYNFSTGDAKIETYPLKGFLTISKPGMIQLSSNLKYMPWYVILVN